MNPYACLLPVSEEVMSISRGIARLAEDRTRVCTAIRIARSLRDVLIAIDTEVTARKSFEAAHLQSLRDLRAEVWQKVEGQTETATAH
jgi:hypothetical protein